MLFCIQFHALEKDVQQQFDGGLNKDPEANTNLPPIPAHLKSAQLVVDASKEVRGVLWWELTGLNGA